MIDLIERDFYLQDGNGNEQIGEPVTKQHFSEVIKDSSYVNLEKHKPVVYLNLNDPRFDNLLSYLQGLSFAKSTRKTLGDGNKSMLFGAVSKKVNHDNFCNIGATVCQSPDLSQALKLEYSTICDYLMRMYLPQYHRVGQAILKHSGIHRDWQMAKSIWTSGVINKNSPHNFHIDSNNVSSGYSAMITLKNRMSGGYLVMPEYNLAFEVSNRSVIFFCGKEIIHGVSRMNIHKNGYRYSIVYYTTSDLRFCGSYSEEMSKSKN